MRERERESLFIVRKNYVQNGRDNNKFIDYVNKKRQK